MAVSKYFKVFLTAGTLWLVWLASGLGTIHIITVEAQTSSSKYGLGLPRSVNSGGSVRGGQNLPLVTMLAPEDGGRTFSPLSTFYWYIAPNDAKEPLKVTFFLRDSEDIGAKPVFKAEGKSLKSGLYRLTLPTSASTALQVGKPQRWQVRLEMDGNLVNVNSVIALSPNSIVNKALVGAKTDLAKARIYREYGYWYDALHAYTRTLELNSRDAIARQERATMVAEILKDKVGFKADKDELGEMVTSTADAKFNLEKLLNQINTPPTAIAQDLVKT